eukprot:gene4867-3488_t
MLTHTPTPSDDLALAEPRVRPASEDGVGVRKATPEREQRQSHNRASSTR